MTKFSLFPLISLILLIVSCSSGSRLEATNKLIGHRLFLKVENEVRISGLKSPERYEMKDTNDSSYPYNKSCQCFKVIGKTGNTQLNLVKKSTGKIVDTYSFAIDELPFPKVMLLGMEQNSNETSVEDLDNVHSLDVEGYYGIVGYEIIGFQLVKVGNGGVIQKASDSNLFTESMKTLMSRTMTGEKLYIESIEVSFPDGSIEMAVPFNFKVIN